MDECAVDHRILGDVEIVINCFERNIRRVTEPGFLSRAFEQHEHAFALRTLLVNNVLDREEALRLATASLRRGDIDRVLFVAEHIEDALRVTRLRRRDFGRYLHWSDCCLVALTVPGPDLLCYVDVDLDLRGRGDWIGEALKIFSADQRVRVANPSWRLADGTTSSFTEADENGPGWYKAYGFTDQAFLCPRSTFAQPLVRRWVPQALICPASARYAGVQAPFRSTLFFERIVDAYMRGHGLLRVTLTSREFEPVPMNSYPPRGLIERTAGKFERMVLHTAEQGRRYLGWGSPRIRLTGLLDPSYPNSP